jgi:hypothetical protein
MIKEVQLDLNSCCFSISKGYFLFSSFQPHITHIIHQGLFLPDLKSFCKNIGFPLHPRVYHKSEEAHTFVPRLIILFCFAKPFI